MEVGPQVRAETVYRRLRLPRGGCCSGHLLRLLMLLELLHVHAEGRPLLLLLLPGGGCRC